MDQIDDVVIKTVMTAYKPMQQEFKEKTGHNCYNCYKLLGFDLLLDSNLKVHVIEVNARPALLDDTLDKAVNRPMVGSQFENLLKDY